MPTLTLKVPSETVARLERHARRRRVSKSTVVREALADKLRKSVDAPSLREAMKHSIGSLDSGVRDLAHNPRHLAGFGRK